jgi:hypothetical protein
MDWRKSSYSGSNGGACVEVGKADLILVRDTTNRDNGTLTFTAKTWQTFITGLK